MSSSAVSLPSPTPSTITPTDAQRRADDERIIAALARRDEYVRALDAPPSAVERVDRVELVGGREGTPAGEPTPDTIDKIDKIPVYSSSPGVLPGPDRSIALAFIEALTGSPDTVLTFQLFPEAPGSTAHAAILYGSLAEHFDMLADANRRGAGLFFAVNEMDGRGRRAENVVALRALVADDDAGTVDVYSVQPQPGIVVYSSRGKQHAYWRLKAGEPLDAFTPAQKSIAAKVRTDPSVCDLARVMRLPGFLHLKGEPQLVTFDQLHAGRFTIPEVLDAMGAIRPVPALGVDTVAAVAAVTDPDAVERAEAYIATIRSVAGDKGNNAAFKAASWLLNDAALPRDLAWGLLSAWNQTNATPAWSEAELRRIFDNAEKYGTHARGAAYDSNAELLPSATPRRGIARYGFITLKDVQEEEQAFLWDGFVPEGAFCLFEGNPDAGKTFMALDLAARLSTGRTLPDGEVIDAVPRQRVLFLTAEDSIAKTIVPRLKGCGADLDNIVSQEQTGDSLLLPGCLGDLREAIREYGVKLVVFDALNNYLDASKVNVNREQQVRQALKPVRDLAAEENVTIIGLRHLNKKTDASALHRGAGSIALAAVARSVLLVARHPEDDSLRIVVPQKSNLVADARKAPIGFRITEGGTQIGGKVRAQLVWDRNVQAIGADELLAQSRPGPRAVVAKDAERLLVQLLEDGPRSRADVMAATASAGLNERAVERAAQTLGIEREPNGRERLWKLALPAGGAL
jgi:archaellum biogenesis ATPase FlaH